MTPDTCADGVEGRDWFVGDEAGCGSRLTGAVSSPCTEVVRSRQKKEQNTDTRKPEVEPITILTVALRFEGHYADHSVTIILCWG